MLIKLPFNQTTLVDEIDSDLARHTWLIDSCGLVCRQYDGKLIYLHNVIARRKYLSESKTVHQDGNTLNNTRENLIAG